MGLIANMIGEYKQARTSRRGRFGLFAPLLNYRDYCYLSYLFMSPLTDAK
jgi:hypothetical protein